MASTVAFDNPQAALQALPYGDLAIALYASPDGPLGHRAPLEDIAEAASKGVAALGGLERVHDLHRRWREWNRRLLRRRIDENAYAEAIGTWLESMSPPGAPADPERLERCIGLDFGRLIPDGRPARRHPYTHALPA